MSNSYKKQSLNYKLGHLNQKINQILKKKLEAVLLKVIYHYQTSRILQISLIIIFVKTIFQLPLESIRQKIHK